MKFALVFISIFVASLALSAEEYSASDYLTGNWGGLRSNLAERGLTLEAVYKAEYWGAFHKGVESEYFFVDNSDIILEWDLEKAFGWKGWLFRLYVLGNDGKVPKIHSESVSHGVSNIIAHPTWKIYTLFLERKFFDDRLSILFGTFDFNSEFDVQNSAGLFLNPCYGIGTDIAQSGENGPSIFPTTSLALRVRTRPFKNVYAQAAVFDGVPGDPNNPNGTRVILKKSDGFFCAAEGGYDNENDDSESFLKAGVGAWYYTSSMDYLASHITNWGAYVFFDKNLFRESDGKGELNAFARIGIADELANEIISSVIVGFNYKGLIPGRDEDEFGAALSFDRRKLYYLYGTIPLHDPRSEGDYEIAYKFVVNGAVAVQADLQKISYPLWDKKRDEPIWVAGIRTILNF